MVIEDKTDWKRFKNAVKLMTMNYWFRRNGSNCTNCKEAYNKETREEACEEACEEAAKRLEEEEENQE